MHISKALTDAINLNQSILSKSKTLPLLGNQGLTNLGSKYTSTTVKVAVWATISISSLLFTPLTGISLYIFYDQYLKRKGIQVIEKNNLSWVHQKYFEGVDSKKEEAKIFLEKLKLDGILRAHTLIVESPTEKIDNLFRLYSAPSLDFLSGILKDGDKKAIEAFFHKGETLPKWAELLIHFVIQSAAAPDLDKKAILQQAFDKFYQTFGPFHEKSSSADKAAIELFSLLLTKAPEYSVVCINALKNGDLETTSANWRELFNNHIFAPQALAALAEAGQAIDIESVEAQAQELEKAHLQNYLENKYGSYFYPYVAEKIVDLNEEISVSTLAKQLFPDASFNTASAIRKELFINEKFDVTEGQMEQLIKAAERYNQKNIKDSAKIVAIMFCCGRPADRIFEHANAVLQRANRDTHKAYKAAVLLVENEEYTQKLIEKYGITDELYQGLVHETFNRANSVEKLQLLQFLSACQHTSSDQEAVEQLVESKAYRQFAPLQEGKEFNRTVKELIASKTEDIALSLQVSEAEEELELVEEDKKFVREKNERDAYWLLMQLLPSILFPGDKKISRVFSLPNEQSRPDILKDFLASRHMQPDFRELIRTLDGFGNTGAALTVIDAIRDCIPSDQDVSRLSTDNEIDARFLSLYEKLDPTNQAIFSSVIASQNRINCNGPDNEHSFALTTGARIATEYAAKVTAELMVARNSDEKQPSNMYQGIAKNLHRLCSYASVSAIKFSLGVYNSPYNPLRKAINRKIVKLVLSSIQTPAIKEHFEKNGEKIVETIALAIPSLCDNLHMEEILRKIKVYDQALSNQNLAEAMNALVDLCNFLAGENSPLIGVADECLKALRNSGRTGSSKRSGSDTDSVAETETSSWDFMSDTASELSSETI